MQGNTKREQFFTTALQLFHEKGFKATTMRNIAERMSFDVANIYNYIDNKQSLLETYLFGISKEFHDGVEDVLASSYSPKEKLKARCWRLRSAQGISITKPSPGRSSGTLV